MGKSLWCSLPRSLPHFVAGQAPQGLFGSWVLSSSIVLRYPPFWLPPPVPCVGSKVGNWFDRDTPQSRTQRRGCEPKSPDFAVARLPQKLHLPASRGTAFSFSFFFFLDNLPPTETPLETPGCSQRCQLLSFLYPESLAITPTVTHNPIATRTLTSVGFS